MRGGADRPMHKPWSRVGPDPSLLGVPEVLDEVELTPRTIYVLTDRAVAGCRGFVLSFEEFASLEPRHAGSRFFGPFSLPAVTLNSCARA